MASKFFLALLRPPSNCRVDTNGKARPPHCRRIVCDDSPVANLQLELFQHQLKFCEIRAKNRNRGITSDTNNNTHKQLNISLSSRFELESRTNSILCRDL